MTEKDIVICGHGSGKPSTKNMYTYNESRYNSYASNGKHKGVIEVRRYKGLSEADRKNFHDIYKTILGRNVYSQNYRDFVYTAYNGTYYSDCSSSGMATFKKMGKKMEWLLNTAGIHSSSYFETVPVKIVSGHITNPEILQVGDAILYVGSDTARPLQIGHVEYVYEMPTAKAEPTPTAPQTAATFSPYLVKTITTLNVREGIGTSYKIVGVLLSGHQFTIRDEKDGWGKVCVISDSNNKVVNGWVSLKYVKRV